MSVINGAMESSGVTLLFFKFAYDDGYNLAVVQALYSSICLNLLIVGIGFLVPQTQELESWRRGITARVDDEGDTKIDEDGDTVYDEPYEPEPTYDDVYEPSRDKWNHTKLGELLRSPSVSSAMSLPFLLNVLFFSVLHLKLFHFVGTIEDVVAKCSKYDSLTTSYYVNIFGYIQFAGLLVTPLVGLIYDRYRICDSILGPDPNEEHLTDVEVRIKRVEEGVLPLFIVSTLALLLSFFGLSCNLKVQIVSFVLYTVVRGFLYTSLGWFVAAAFPEDQFGTLYGLSWLVSGIVGICQYPIYYATSETYNGDHTPMTALLICLTAVSFIFPVYLHFLCRRQKRFSL